MRKGLKSIPVETGAALALLVIFAFFSWRTPLLNSFENTKLLMKQSAELAIVGAGMTLVIATGGIDLSVGSVLGLSAMTMGLVSVHTRQNLLLCCFASLLTGGLCGLLNGLLIARAKLPPILATLAIFAAARAGAALISTSGISQLPLGLNSLFEQTLVAGLPLLFWISLAALGAASLLLRRTTFGRSLLALGGNRTATEMSGVRTARAEMTVYLISGFCAGLAAIVNTALKATATPDAGTYLELQAITAVALGGTAIAGGQATLLGTGLGVLIITLLISGIRLMGQQDQLAWLLIGIALLLSVEAQKKASGRTK